MNAAATHSAVYEGSVHHHRRGPREHGFGQKLFFMYLDLDELETVFRGRWLWSVGRPNLVWLRRADYLGPAERPLSEAVRDRVEAQLGRRPTGPVRMLTHLRTLGYVFNPVTFYYVFGEDEQLDAVVAEITNTPWKERHAYVLDAADCEAGPMYRWRFAKDFHVSPFFDMDHVYDWRFSAPGERLEVHMSNHRQGERVFDVGLKCRRRELTAGRLAFVLLRYPWLTARVHLAIYIQALLLWIKRTPFFAHPAKRASAPEVTT